MFLPSLSFVLHAASEASASASRYISPRRFLASSVPSSSSSTTPTSIRSVSSVHLGNLSPAQGSTRDNVRKGRGNSSTKGGQSGRGHKGQRARSGNGKPHPGFEGGQTPITRLFPKRGFTNFTSRKFAPLPLSRLQSFIASNRINPNLPITIGTVVRSNLVHGLSTAKGNCAGVKLLGQVNPELPLPKLDLELSRFSKSAAEAVERAGGRVTAVYHNRLSLRQEIWPEKFVGREVKEAKPIRRTDIEYYSDPKKHGYLSKTTPQVAE